MSENSASAKVLLTHEVGLHARPSVKLTKLAKSFASEIRIAATDDGPWIDAKSIVKVMALKVPKDSVHVRRVAPERRPCHNPERTPPNPRLPGRSRRLRQ